jgi:hypothetical protein
MSILSIRGKTTSPITIAAMLLGMVYLLLDQYIVNKADVNSLLTSRVPFVRANVIEAFFWITVGLGFGTYATYHAIRQKQWQILPLTTAATLFIFGISDFVEANTGAWWRPWPLLFWKASCVIAFVILFIAYRMKKKPAVHHDGT